MLSVFRWLLPDHLKEPHAPIIYDALKYFKKTVS